MSEDEAIKRLQEILDFKKNTIDKIEDPIEREIEENCYIEEMPFKAIETILDLYNKEKEKNKEIEIRLQEEINEVCEMKTRLFGNSISKDKIRAKIKSLEEKIHIVIPNEYNKIEVMNEFKNEGAVDVLTELLKEE